VQSTKAVDVRPSNSILSGTRPDQRCQTANVVANGQNEVFNNQMIDGMDNNEREQFTILMRPSIDMIQEVKVDTNSYPAEVGRATELQIQSLTDPESLEQRSEGLAPQARAGARGAAGEEIYTRSLHPRQGGVYCPQPRDKIWDAG
jgi:hypothetical protein